VIELVNANSVSVPLADKSVHLIVTSPPYFGLRAYGAGDGEIGAEPTPDEFIEALVTVGRECWRVLRDDGVMVVNLGDSRDDGVLMGIPHRVKDALVLDGWRWQDTVIWRKKSAMPESVNGTRWERCRVKVGGGWGEDNPHPSQTGGVNYGRENKGATEWQDCPGCPKCEANDGLVLRRGSWRTTSAHEYIFVFAKRSGYFADREAVREASAPASIERMKSGWNGNDQRDYSGGTHNHLAKFIGTEKGMQQALAGANPRSVRTFKATPFKGKHYATFPTTLPEFFIRAFTSEAGVCAECGEPWARVIGDGGIVMEHGSRKMDEAVDRHVKRESLTVTGYNTLGFRRTCQHDAPAVPAVVLDPFAGSGSTLIAARQLGRSGIGLDLNLGYITGVASERLGLNAVRAWTDGKGKQGETKLDGLPMFEDVG